MPKISVVPKDPPPPEPPPEPEIAEDDPRYFLLSEPITVAGKTINKLLVDSALARGPVYFKIIDRYSNEHPAEFRKMLIEYTDRFFLGYLVTELNPPMILEDLRKLCLADLPALYAQTANFLLAERPAKLAKMKTLRAETL